jgi:NAD(P)-dependent dehydrogenase (short-subunit alcohol dehydrogenase family)
MVETRILNRGQLTPEQYELDKQRYPLKRYGKPEDVAWAIIYLLSDASSWVTGTALKLDGGMTLE